MARIILLLLLTAGCMATPSRPSQPAHQSTAAVSPLRFPPASQSLSENAESVGPEFHAWYSAGHMTQVRSALAPGYIMVVVGHCYAATQNAEAQSCSEQIARVVLNGLVDEGFPRSKLGSRGTGHAPLEGYPPRENFVHFRIEREQDSK